MVDNNSLLFLMGIPAVIGFLLETKFRDVVRPLALLLSIPTIMWLYFLGSFLINTPPDEIDIVKVIPEIFGKNFETLILSYVGGAIGTGTATALFGKRK